jgi:hypothetical protein
MNSAIPIKYFNGRDVLVSGVARAVHNMPPFKAQRCDAIPFVRRCGTACEYERCASVTKH